jgi:hypothetical protein
MPAGNEGENRWGRSCHARGPMPAARCAIADDLEFKVSGCTDVSIDRVGKWVTGSCDDLIDAVIQRDGRRFVRRWGR